MAPHRAGDVGCPLLRQRPIQDDRFGDRTPRMPNKTLYEPLCLLSGQTIPIRYARDVWSRPATLVFGDLAQFVLTLVLVEGIEHRLAVVRQKRFYKDRVHHAIRRTVGDHSCHDALLEVAHDNNVPQIVRLQDPEHVVDMSRQPNVRNIGIFGQSRQRDRVDVRTERTQPTGHRFPDPGTHPSTGDQNKVRHTSRGANTHI